MIEILYGHLTAQCSAKPYCDAIMRNVLVRFVMPVLSFLLYIQVIEDGRFNLKFLK